MWTADHQLAFNKVKEVLVSPPTLAHFDPRLPTAIQTDASRTKGMGYALLQRQGDTWRLIQCGSRFLSDTERDVYSVGELELTAAVWGIRKCKLYLLGLPSFDLVLDHKPLVQIINSYTLDQAPTPRQIRLKEKLAGYSVHAVWRKGKEHAIPDALSRAPFDLPDDEDKLLEDETTAFVRSVIAAAVTHVSDDPLLDEIRSCAPLDTDYQQLVTLVTTDFPKSKSNCPDSLRPFWNVRNDLAYDDNLVLYKSRIVIPAALRKEVLTRLHASHRGTEATKRRAAETVWWPAINSDIISTTEACAECQTYRPSLQKEPLLRDHTPSRPFESVSSDLFTHGGRMYLIYADRYSGWTEVHQYKTDATSRTTIHVLRRYFAQFGVPVIFRSDGGPQFSSHLFQAFMNRWKVRHEMSTPHHHEANGHAEACLKSIKHLVMKTKVSGDLYENEEFLKGLLELRNTPNASGLAPAKILLGRPLRSIVPMHRSQFDVKWQEIAERLDARQLSQSKADARYDSHARRLPVLSLGAPVRVQDPATKRWTATGVIVGVGTRRDYLVKTASGSTLWLNRRFLSPIPPPLDSATVDPPSEPEPTSLREPQVVSYGPNTT